MFIGITLLIIGFLVLLFALSLITWGLKWAVLVPKSNLPLILRQTHADWWPFLRWISRRLTAFFGGREPAQLMGSNPKDHHQDVPVPGTWCLSWPIHFALLTKGKKLFALGVRRDYVDSYWTIRFVWRKL
jgi:hypothetical protein